MRKLLTAKDIKEYTQFSESKVYRLFNDDPKFKSFKHSGSWRITDENFKESIEELI